MKKYLLFIIALVVSLSAYAEEPLWSGRYRVSGTGYCVEMQQYTSSIPDYVVTVDVYDDCITIDGRVCEYVRSIGRGTKVYRDEWLSINGTDCLYYVRLDRSMYLEHVTNFYGTMTTRYDMEALD